MTQVVVGPIRYMGEWDFNNPSKFKEEERQTECEMASVGRGIEIAKRGARLVISGGLTRFYMHQSMPGVHSIWFAIEGSSIKYDTFKLKLKARLKTKAKIHRLESAALYTFSKEGLRKYSVAVHPTPPIEESTLAKSAPQLLSVMVKAAKEMFEPWKGKKIVSLLSGGTDGTLTTLALMQAGFDVEAVCVGVSAEDFDPLWADRYAQDLGVPYTLVKVPTDEETLTELLYRAVGNIEMPDYSNVLMAMCTSLANDKAKELGSEVVVHGHFADDVIGNEMFTVGEFRKRVKLDPSRDTSEEWRDLRYEETMMIFPNTLQVDRGARGDGMHWRSIFTHPDVLDFILSRCKSVCVTAKDKPLFQQALEPYLSDCAWKHTHKIGYYTGSGIGELRKGRDYLSDSAMREALKHHSN